MAGLRSTNQMCMRIGIDFGTSYSAAGAVVDGQLQLIRFGADHQFRTTVFFPLRMPDVAQFELTEQLDEQVRALVAGAKRDQTQELARVQRLHEEAMRRPAHAPKPWPWCRRYASDRTTKYSAQPSSRCAGSGPPTRSARPWRPARTWRARCTATRR